MAKYTNEYSHFPSKVMTVSEYKDVNDDVSNMINTIKRYQAEGRYDAAAAYAQQNKEFLQKYLIGSADLMRLQEEIRNAQIYSLQQSQSIYVQDDEPDVLSDTDVWIGA